MDNAIRRVIEHACQHLSIAYAHTADFGHDAAFANLFTDDAVLETSLVQVRGKAEIEASMKKRPAELRSRHIITNMLIDVIDEDHARGLSYLSLYRHVGPESLQSEPIDVSGPAIIGHYDDRFVRTPMGWRFERRKLHVAFRRAASFPTEREG